MRVWDEPSISSPFSPAEKDHRPILPRTPAQQSVYYSSQVTFGSHSPRRPIPDPGRVAPQRFFDTRHLQLPPHP